MEGSNPVRSPFFTRLFLSGRIESTETPVDVAIFAIEKLIEEPLGMYIDIINNITRPIRRRRGRPKGVYVCHVVGRTYVGSADSESDSIYLRRPLDY